MPRVTDREPQPLGQALRPELGDEHRAGGAVAVSRSFRLGQRRRPPAFTRAEVQLVLEDEEAAPLEQRDPFERRALQVPAVVFVLPGRDAHEQATVVREHPAELAQRRFVALVVARVLDPVDGVVAADVLERRDAEPELEAAALERQSAHVGDHVGGLGEVDGDQLGSRELAEPFDVRLLRVRGADVDHSGLARIARQHPRDLDGALVAPGRRFQLPWTAAACSLGARSREPVVEQLDALELAALDELADEPRP